MSQNGPEQANVDAEQRRLDVLDRTADQKIDVGQTDRTPEELGETYLKKTNDLQGKIRELQRQADVLRDMRNPAWQTLEDACITTEQGLLSLLKTIDEQNVVEQADAFAEKVRLFTVGLEAASEQGNERASEKPAPRPIAEMFESILSPVDEAGKAKCADLALEAISHYSTEELAEEDMRLIESRLSLFEAMSPELMASLFPHVQMPSGKDVVYQLARGMLGVSPNAFLIADPAPEDIIRDAREKGIDELKTAEKELNERKYTLSKVMEGLAKRTSESADDSQIALDLKIIETVQKDVQNIQAKMQDIGTRVSQLDLSLVRQNVAVARSNGRTTDADRTLIRVQEQYGTTLEMLDPALAEEAKEAEKTVTLSEFEKVLKGEKPGSAVDIAVQEARDSAAAADILDQVQARTVARFSRVTNADDYFSKHAVTDSTGEKKSDFFKKYAYTDITDGSGKKISVALTPEAKQRIETLPRGAKPVILKNITSLSFQTTGGGRGGVMSYKYTGNDFNASLLDAKDIGTTTNAGDVMDADGQPIDMNTDPRAPIAREQIGKQKSFTISEYVPKAGIHMLTVDGKPYDKRLINIKTASGKAYEGVKVAVDASEILKKPAPEGMTLVLAPEKGRELRNISLRTRETEGVGRNTKQVQRVIDTDTITVSDLAYAKIDDNELTIAGVNDPTKSTKASAPDLLRKREEDGRDVLRAIDHSESIKQTTQAASAIGESMSHLQKLMSAGNEGSMRQGMVDFARAEAEPMLKMLRSPDTTASVNLALTELNALKKANLGVALGGVERDINARIQSLEQFAQLLQSGKVADIFETIMDKSRFDADTWSRWFSTELPKILAAIAVATAVVVTLIFTFGGAAPLWAVSATTLNIMIAAGGAAGGMIGAELGAEGVRKGRQILDKDVRSGRLAYSNRSRLGAYLEGQEMLDPETGKKIPMEFIKDVASPYAQELAFSFVTTYAALGLGTIVASRLTSLAQNNTWVQGLATRSPMANRIMSYLSQIGDDAARVGAEKSSLIKTWFNESIDELKDEFVKEKGVEAVLAQVDERLGPCAAFLLTVARGFKPMSVPTRPSALLGDFTSAGVPDMPRLEETVKAQGYPSVINAGEYVAVTDHDGHTFKVYPETTGAEIQTKNRSSDAEGLAIDTKTQSTATDAHQMMKNGGVDQKNVQDIPAERFLTEKFFGQGSEKTETGIAGDYTNYVLSALPHTFNKQFPEAMRLKWRATAISGKLTYDQYLQQRIDEWNADPDCPKIHFSDPAIQKLRNEELNAVVESINESNTDDELQNKLHTVAVIMFGPSAKMTSKIDTMMGYTNALESNLQQANDQVMTEHSAEDGDASTTEEKLGATANDVHQMTQNGEVGLIGARNRTGASPEVTQEAAVMLVNDRVALANSVVDPATRTEAVARYNALLKAQGGKELSEADVVKNCEKFAKVVAAIESGSIGLEGKYIGSAIRDLHNLMPGIDMEVKVALDRRLHTASMKKENEARIGRNEEPFANMDQYMEWLLSPDQTIVGGRPETPNGEFDAQDAVHLETNPEVRTRLSPVVDAMSTLANDPNATFTRAQVEQILAANPELDSVDRTILLETAVLLEGIKPKAGDDSLPDAERWKILEFSARYVQDFRASPEFKATPQQLLELVADNAVNLGHQNIMDHMTLVGSSHGTLHVLRGNSEMLNSLFGQMGFTPAMRVLAMQATFDHDMGYTKRTLVGKTAADGVFDSSKDHPLESTLRVESKREAYEQIFRREGYVTIRNAVLDHSDAMGQKDKQYADYAAKLDLIADPNAPPADRVAAAVALVDCLATVSNLKASPLFKNNPEIVATMARIEQLHRDINGKVADRKATLMAEGMSDAEANDGAKTFERTSTEVAALRAEAKSMRIAMQDRITQMRNIPAETRQAYLTALDSTMQWEDSNFAITSNLGMLAASVSPELKIDAEGKVHATYTVDINGLATISSALDPKAAAKAATSGIMKAADDFGKLTPESQQELDTFVMHAGNVESKDTQKRTEAEAYFAANGGAVSLPTNSRLVIEVKVGKNPEYEATRLAVETGLRIDAIRGLARANVEKLVRGEPITVEGVDGKRVEILDATALQTYAESSVAKYIASLPANYVMENARGEYVPIVKAFNEAKTAARTSPVTWQQFADRMFRTAGSSAPLQSQRKAA